MKTFDEAIDTCIVLNDPNDPVRMAANGEQLVSQARRYIDIAQEASDHPKLQGAIVQLLHLAADERLEVPEVMFSMFMLGLQVGMEMEKP